MVYDVYMSTTQHTNRLSAYRVARQQGRGRETARIIVNRMTDEQVGIVLAKPYIARVLTGAWLGL